MDKFKVQKREYVSKTIRIPRDLFSELDMLLHEKEVSFNQLVIQCCQYALDHLDDNQS